MSRPKRDKYTNWWNMAPIADLHEALHLLNEELPWISEDAFIRLHDCRSDKGGFPWEIILPWYREGSSGGDASGYHYLQIDPNLAEHLVAEELVDCRRKYQGSLILPDEYVISATGRRRWLEFFETMRTKAVGMLKPGIHTDLTGKPLYRGADRDHWRCGNLYFKFEVPLGGDCRVYPEEERILMPDQIETKAA